MKFVKDLLWKQPRVCFLPAVWLLLWHTLVISPCLGPVWENFGCKADFLLNLIPMKLDSTPLFSPTISQRQGKAFHFCCSIKKLITRQTGWENWHFPVWAQHAMARGGIRLKEVEAAPEPCPQCCRIPGSPPPALGTPSPQCTHQMLSLTTKCSTGSMEGAFPTGYFRYFSVPHTAVGRMMPDHHRPTSYKTFSKWQGGVSFILTDRRLAALSSLQAITLQHFCCSPGGKGSRSQK